MGTVVEYCEKCGRNTDHMILEISDGVDSWVIAIVKCGDCGKEKTININS